MYYLYEANNAFEYKFTLVILKKNLLVKKKEMQYTTSEALSRIYNRCEVSKKGKSPVTLIIYITSGGPTKGSYPFPKWFNSLK